MPAVRWLGNMKDKLKGGLFSKQDLKDKLKGGLFKKGRKLKTEV